MATDAPLLAAADGSNGDEILRRIAATPEEPPPTPPGGRSGVPDFASLALTKQADTGGKRAPSSGVPDFAALALKSQPEAIPQVDAEMDARDKQADPEYRAQVNAGIQQTDRERARPSWLKGAWAQAHPRTRDFALNAITPFIQPPEQNEATARGLVKGVAAIPGNFENLMDNTIPQAIGASSAPRRTFFPTSEDMDKHLADAGWKGNPAWADYEKSADLGASLLVPASESSKAVERGLGVMSSEGKASTLTRKGVEDVKQAANEGTARIVGQHPMPVGPDVPPIYPDISGRTPKPAAMPTPPTARPQPVAPTPAATIPPGRMVPKNDVNTVLEGHLAENEGRLKAAKGKAWEEYKAGVQNESDDVVQARNPNPGAEPVPNMSGAKPINTDDLLDKWQTSSAARSPTVRKAIEKVTNDIKDIRERGLSHADEVQAMHELKREVSEAGKGVEDATGYGALKGNVARDMAGDINAAIKEASPAYRKFTKDYHELSSEAEPLDRTFLKGVGSDEGTVQMEAALKDRKNVRSTIEALGPGGKEKFDALAARHITSSLSGKTGASLERAVTNMRANVRELPQAREALERTLTNAQANEATAALAKKAMEEHKDALAAWKGDTAAAEAKFAEDTRAATASNQKGFSEAMKSQQREERAAQAAADAKNATTAEFRTNAQKAQDLADSYKPAINGLQRATLKQRPAAMRSMVDKMAKDKLITDAQHDAFLVQIKEAEKANNLSAKLSTLSKYIGYSLTGNYMLSFGGPHAYEFAREKLGK